MLASDGLRRLLLDYESLAVAAVRFFGQHDACRRKICDAICRDDAAATSAAEREYTALWDDLKEATQPFMGR